MFINTLRLSLIIIKKKQSAKINPSLIKQKVITFEWFEEIMTQCIMYNAEIEVSTGCRTLSTQNLESNIC